LGLRNPRKKERNRCNKSSKLKSSKAQSSGEERILKREYGPGLAMLIDLSITLLRGLLVGC